MFLLLTATMGSVRAASSNLKDRSKDSLDRSLRLELATTYGPQISEELLAIRTGKDIQLSLETLVFAADSEIPEASNSSGTSCFFLLIAIWGP